MEFPLNLLECLELRDILFAAKLNNEYKESVFRYLAVIPAELEGGAPTLHFAFVPAAWHRARMDTSSSLDVVRTLLEMTPYRERQVQVQQVDYLRGGWALPWDLTAKDASNDFPTLVIKELADSSATGVLMSDSNTCGTGVTLADRYAEPLEAEEIVGILRALNPGMRYGGWWKVANIDASSVKSAMELAKARSPSEQQVVQLYRDNEWFTGLSSNSSMRMTSIADFHGTRISAAKKLKRSDLSVARKAQTLQGDYPALQAAVSVSMGESMDDFADDYESAPSTRLLCAWWNQVAPVSHKSAATFRVYVWSSASSIFKPADSEEPAITAENLARSNSYCLFDSPEGLTFAITFMRGKEFNNFENGYTDVYFTNGDHACSIGQALSEVDEAYYAHIGLQRLQRYL